MTREQRQKDFGLPVDRAKGYGWDHDIRADNRRRNVYAEAQRDTFLFTRSAAHWECVVPSGRWSVTICAGDSICGIAWAATYLASPTR